MSFHTGSTPTEESHPLHRTRTWVNNDMFYTYILRSLNDGTYYYGHAKNAEERSKTHNKGKERYTKGHIPYVLHYCEQYQTRREAVVRERFFKSIDGYNWLRSKGLLDSSTEGCESGLRRRRIRLWRRIDRSQPEANPPRRQWTPSGENRF